MTSNTIKVNRSVKIMMHTGKMQITKAFAEANLSKSALKYAEKTETHYFFDWGKNSYIVVYELPTLFNVHFGELMRYLINYCMDYVRENNLNDAVMYPRFMENCQKVVKV